MRPPVPARSTFMLLVPGPAARLFPIFIHTIALTIFFLPHEHFRLHLHPSTVPTLKAPPSSPLHASSHTSHSIPPLTLFKPFVLQILKHIHTFTQLFRIVAIIPHFFLLLPFCLHLCSSSSSLSLVILKLAGCICQLVVLPLICPPKKKPQKDKSLDRLLDRCLTFIRRRPFSWRSMRLCRGCKVRKNRRSILVTVGSGSSAAAALLIVHSQRAAAV
ncbi:hypothetical protein CBOM_08149 [Ceraceosorus bombacis]|uniref:Uncharacterized protein n=1 Tax=Ceraceosorus bombacis TaxID=401625 RepID=A0A0P1BAS1_9BASI|nr:hypothetical protein CBOM_08149 [Ceraceosorus bombacis]